MHFAPERRAHESAELADLVALGKGLRLARGSATRLHLLPKCLCIAETLEGSFERLYRNEILQVSVRLKALAEIYTMHSFAQL